MTTAWTEVAKPVRGASPDGFNAEGSGDGFYAPRVGDGFLVSDGVWTPILMDLDTWTQLAKPTDDTGHLADGSHIADGSILASESTWVAINV